MTTSGDPVRLEGGGRNTVLRRGNVVIREARPWTPAVHALLRHPEQAGFAAAPRLAGSGLDVQGRETLAFIDGEFTQHAPAGTETNLLVPRHPALALSPAGTGVARSARVEEDGFAGGPSVGCAGGPWP